MERIKFIGGVDFDELRAQRVKVYETIDIDLSAAQSNKEFPFTGTYLYAVEASDINATINIKLNEKFRSELPMVKGRGYRAPFYRFYLTNTAQAGKWIKLAIGVESETFEVFDVGKALEITEKALDYERSYIYTYVVAAAVGEKSHLQLWNPGGIDALVRRLFGRIATANEKVAIRYGTTALTTNIGAAVPKKLGALTTSTCLFKSQTNAAYLGVHMIELYPGGQNNAFDLVFDPAIWIPKDYGLQMAGPDNCEINVGFEWLEV